MKKYQDKKFLRDKYVCERLTYEQIADISGTTIDNIKYWIKKYKIHRRRLPKSSQRKRNKRAALNYLGNQCCICTYSRCETSLEFHHVHPEDKKYTISSALGKQWKTLKKELDKCVLVCKNCHCEIHSGVADYNRVDKAYAKARRRNDRIQG